MGEPLKNHFGPEIPKRISGMIQGVQKSFLAKPFLKDALAGYEELELMQRAEHIAVALRKHLPEDFPKASRALVDALGPKLEKTEGNGMAPFIYAPFDIFIREYGLGHFEDSMTAIHAITQRFTSESSIRPFLIHRQKETLAQLQSWIEDDSVHVRRLVSEGTRPLLPWNPRIPAFRKNPKPVIKLLRQLRDDPELYVRRSVANNLNDIGKDNPEVLTETTAKWMKGASAERVWLIRHALRGAIKAMNPDALAVLGYGKASGIKVSSGMVDPDKVRIGDSVVVHFDLKNTSKEDQKLLVDFQIHYIKANGKPSAKVFKLKETVLKPAETEHFQKKVSVADMTTRKHYPGRHKVDVAINGQLRELSHFDLER